MPARRLHLLVVALLTACTAAPSPGGVVSETPAASQASPSPVASGPPTGVSTPAPSAPAGPPLLAVELVVDGLLAPIGVVGGPDGALYVQEQAGRVIAVAPDGGTRPFLDISDRVRGRDEQGLLGLAFHPDFADNRRLFVHYSRVGDGATVISEVEASADGLSANPASERVLLTVAQPFANHNGGQLGFGPDGFLYIALGDGGSGGDPLGHGQNPDTLLGSILRIDVDGEPAGGAAYAIPPDNPFADGGGAPEVWAYGLRNPWRFSFDRETGDLWIGDVGQNAFEEIDRQPAASSGGENYGWNAMEASRCFATPDCDPSAYVGPITAYRHADGDRAVVGGFVYRGETHAALRERYVFGDYGSGRIWTILADSPTPTPGQVVPPDLALDSELVISSFGEAADGELYLTDLHGALYRLTIAPGG